MRRGNSECLLSSISPVGVSAPTADQPTTTSTCSVVEAEGGRAELLVNVLVLILDYTNCHLVYWFYFRILLYKFHLVSRPG